MLVCKLALMCVQIACTLYNILHVGPKPQQMKGVGGKTWQPTFLKIRNKAKKILWGKKLLGVSDMELPIVGYD